MSLPQVKSYIKLIRLVVNYIRFCQDWVKKKVVLNQYSDPLYKHLNKEKDKLFILH